MVSEFLTEIDKRLHLQQTDIEKHPHVPEEAQCYLKPGINQESIGHQSIFLNKLNTKQLLFLKLCIQTV